MEDETERNRETFWWIWDWDGVSVPVPAKTKRLRKISPPGSIFTLGSGVKILFKKSYLLPQVTNYECNFSFDHLKNWIIVLKWCKKKVRQKFAIGNLLLSSALFRQAAPKCTPLWHLPIAKMQKQKRLKMGKGKT